MIVDGRQAAALILPLPLILVSPSASRADRASLLIGSCSASRPLKARQP
jgi:hypothetical protein